MHVYCHMKGDNRMPEVLLVLKHFDWRETEGG